jgi:uncharacterized membrane protein (UPF0127 family)
MNIVRPFVPLVLAAFLVLGVACSDAPATESEAFSNDSQTARASFSTSSGSVETSPLWVADSDDERERGLMGRTSLPPDGGMVFHFAEPTDAGFWMKDTRLPLSIAFWDRTGRIIAILDMEPCTNDPCPVYRAGATYETALEMRRGWFDEHGVGIGDRVELIDGPA